MWRFLISVIAVAIGLFPTNCQAITCGSYSYCTSCCGVYTRYCCSTNSYYYETVSSSFSLGAGVIAGIVTGVGLLITASVVGCYFCCCRRRQIVPPLNAGVVTTTTYATQQPGGTVAYNVAVPQGPGFANTGSQPAYGQGVAQQPGFGDVNSGCVTSPPAYVNEVKSPM